LLNRLPEQVLFVCQEKDEFQQVGGFFLPCVFSDSCFRRAGYTHLLLDTFYLHNLQPTSQVNWQKTKQNLTTVMGFHGLAGRFNSEGGEIFGVKGWGKVC